jgi:hypothetical protein
MHHPITHIRTQERTRRRKENTNENETMTRERERERRKKQISLCLQAIIQLNSQANEMRVCMSISPVRSTSSVVSPISVDNNKRAHIEARRKTSEEEKKDYRWALPVLKNEKESNEREKNDAYCFQVLVPSFNTNIRCLSRLMK